jgi:thiol-disulfide isomerase/thioredoxin
VLSAQHSSSLNADSMQQMYVRAMQNNPSLKQSLPVESWQEIKVESKDHKHLHQKAPILRESSLDGTDFNVGDTGKIQVLSFWFVGCLPCHFEIPHLNRIFEDYKDDPEVELLSLCRDDAERINKYYTLNGTIDSIAFQGAKNEKIQYPVIARARLEALEYRVFNFPTTFVIDSQGVVQFVSRGFAIHPNDKDYFYKMLKKAIEEVRAGNTIALASES